MSMKDAASKQNTVLGRMVSLIEKGCAKKLAASIAVAESQGQTIKHEEKLNEKNVDIKE